MTEGRLGQQIQIAIQIDIDKAEPLANRQLLKVIRDPAKAGQPIVAQSLVAKKHHLIRDLLQKEIRIAIAIRRPQAAAGAD